MLVPLGRFTSVPDAERLAPSMYMYMTMTSGGM